MFIRDFFELFLEQLAGQSRESQRNYRHRLRFFVRDYGDLRPDEVTVAHVNEWHRLMLDLGHAEATNAGYRQAIKSFFNWFVEEGVLTVSPAKHLKLGSFLPEQVSLPDEADVQAVCDVAFAWCEADDYASVRRAAVWFYAYESMCRLGGLARLQLADIQNVLKRGPNNHGSYRVRSKEKTGVVIHEFTEVTAYALAHCIRLRPETKSKLFLVGSRATVTNLDDELRVRGMTKRAITKDFETICAAAGVDAIRCHSLRHRGGDLLTRLYGAKVASHKLNHSNIKTTLQYYHKADQDDVSRATARIKPSRGAVKRPDGDQLAALFFGTHD